MVKPCFLVRALLPWTQVSSVVRVVATLRVRAMRDLRTFTSSPPAEFIAAASCAEFIASSLFFFRTVAVTHKSPLPYSVRPRFASRNDNTAISVSADPGPK